MRANEILQHRMAIRMLNSKQLAEMTGYAHSTVLAWVNGKNQISFFSMQVCLDAMGYELKIEVKK